MGGGGFLRPQTVVSTSRDSVPNDDKSNKKDRQLGYEGTKKDGEKFASGESMITEVITPNISEIYARSKNKRPPKYIYLGNGNALRYVLEQCKGELSDSLLSVIERAIDRTDYTDSFCLNCQGLIPKAREGRPMLLCDACVPKHLDYYHTQMGHTATRSPLVDSSSPIPSSGCLVLESEETLYKTQCQTK